MDDPHASTNPAETKREFARFAWGLEGRGKAKMCGHVRYQLFRKKNNKPLPPDASTQQSTYLEASLKAELEFDGLGLAWN
jgi:hypothetical protein